MNKKKQASHTPTPWVFGKVETEAVCDRKGYVIHRSDCGHIVFGKEDTAFIVRAVNSYESLRNSHEALVKALKTLVEHAKETYPHFEDVRGQKDIFNALQALAQAEKL